MIALSRSLVCGLVVGLLALTAPARSDDKSPDQRIQELQRQIDEFSKKLSELKKAKPAPPASAPASPALNPEWTKNLTWRCIGPANMGGRITAISVFDADPTTYWIATASGGLLKTTSNGVTFEHQFDKENTVSVGDVCVAPSDRNIVWVGTGENNPRNSVSYGDGVYKSTDGGKTWKHMGLDKSFQIGKIIVHPTNPNIVYVGALGRLYGPNEERGLFKTIDGGKTWQKILYVDAKTGVIDMRMSPADPETLLVATWERLRDGFDTYAGEEPQADGYDLYDPVKKWGPGGGIYRTSNGGKSFTKITKGLPTCSMGRIGLDWCRKNPKVVFAILETEKIGMGTPPAPGPGSPAGYLGIQGEDADAGAKLTRVVETSPAAQAGLKVGDIILSVDKDLVLSYKQLLDHTQKHKPGDKVAFKISRDHESKDITVAVGKRPVQAGGQAGSSTRPYSGFFLSGQRENVQDRQGPEGFQYGGVYKSTDAGDSWTRVNSINPRPMYFSQIRVDPSDDKLLYVLGFAIYRSKDGGKTFAMDANRTVHPDQHALWVDARDGRHLLVGCDGGFYVTYDRMVTWDHLNLSAIGQFYHVALDSRQPYRAYGGLQDNGSWGGTSHSLRNSGPVNDDWITVGGGDGFVCRVDPVDSDLVYWEFQDGNMFRTNLKTAETAYIKPSDPVTKHWRMDPKASAILGFLHAPIFPGGLHQADVKEQYRWNWNTPYIVSNHNPMIVYCAGNRVFRSLKRGNEFKVISPNITLTKRGSATAIAESPLNPDVLYVGADDGALWVTKDGGTKWIDITAKVGLSAPRWVASIEPSRFAPGRAYVAFDAHRSDDDQPYIYVTEDYGETWKSLRRNLPIGSTRVLREDIQNADLLLVGTEFSAWASVDRGQTWVKLNTNLPTVAVHEFAIHPTAGEVVVATHGRSLWVLDVTPLRQMKQDVLKAKVHLFEPHSAVLWRSEPGTGSMYGNGNRGYIGQNPPNGTQIYYTLGQKAEKISLKVVDFAGKQVRELRSENTPGLHKSPWDMRRFADTGGQPRGQQFGGLIPLVPILPGMYRIVLNVDGLEYTQSLKVDADPSVPNHFGAFNLGTELRRKLHEEREVNKNEDDLGD